MSRPDLRVDVKLLDPRLRDSPPHYATAGSAGLDVRAVVATHEPELMKLLDTLTPLSVTEAKRFLDEHGERLNALLEPRRVRGLVLEVATPEAQAVLHELGHDDALVLEQGKTPDTSNEKLQLAAAGVLVALAVAVMLVRAPA